MLSNRLLPAAHFQLLWLDALEAIVRRRHGRGDAGELEQKTAALRAIFGAHSLRERRIEAWSGQPAKWESSAH
jgi:hypothetical protein